MSVPSKSVDYAAVLADLRDKRAKIDAAIRGIESMPGLVAPPRPLNSRDPADATQETARAEAPSATPPSIPAGAFAGKYMSVTEAVESYLRMAHEPRGTMEIADALKAGGFAHPSKAFKGVVNAALQRASHGGGSIVKVGRGVWGLASWRDERVQDETAQATPNSL